MRNQLLIIVLALMTLGCASSGTRIDQASIDKIEKGQTTETDIRQWFGAPGSTMNHSNGDKTISFVFAKAQNDAMSYVPYVGLLLGKSSSETQALQVTFNDQGVVKEYIYSESGETSNSVLETATQ